MDKNFSEKYPFFVNLQLRTLLDFRDDVRPKYSNITQKVFRRFIWVPSGNSKSHPFYGVRYTNFIIFFNFYDYVITTHAVGDDVIGHPDIRNETSRVGQPGTEVLFTLPSTYKELWPLRYSLISYFRLMLRKFCCR